MGLATFQTLNFRFYVEPTACNQPKFLFSRNVIRMSENSIFPTSDLSRSVKFRGISPKFRAKAQSDVAGNGGTEDVKMPISERLLKSGKPLFDFAKINFLPLALVSGVALGLANPTLGCLAHKYHLSKLSTFGIFIISGLTLRSDEVGAAAAAWPVGLFGLISILLLSPYISIPLLQLQLEPQAFVTGLGIFCCMPTTLSSGIALTQLVGGNTALALAMTIVSNLLGILIIPFSLSKFVASGVGVSIPTKQLFGSLIVTLLCPLILGKVIRDYVHSVGTYVDKNRQTLSRISAIFLSLVPWIQVSRSRSLLLGVQPVVFLLAIGMATLLHVTLLVLNTICIQLLSTFSGNRESVFSEKQNSRALIIVASQKTLPVMVAVVEQLGGALGESGMLVLPCVAAHITQIIIDSFLVNFWLREDRTTNLAKEA